ncbi:MAG: ABC transporter substrate-binding protein [Lachnospiraceae bacterium]|nr:ABC transporter substrate-binding protein [Lachnospiraceae bacterium]
MKKYLSIFFVTLLAMTALTGCTGSTGESSEDNTSTTVSTTDTDTTQTGTTDDTNVDVVAPTGEPTYGGTVVVGIQQDIDGLDPHTVTAAGTREILFNIFEGLVKNTANGDLMCAVAEDYSLSEDGLVYTFNLRQGVKFHNGNLVTAEDVKYSLERVSGLLDGTPLISTMKTITAVDILDEKTVQVTVDSVNPELIYSFTAAIIPNGSGEDENANPIGTGPFSFVSYTPQEGIVIAKNADYWQAGLPYLDKVEFKIITSGETALLELQAGTVQVYPYLADSQVTELEGKMQVLSAPSATVQALFLNNSVEPLNNVKVRQAIMYALDKDEINLFVAGGDATVISSAMLPSLESYYVDLNDTYGTSANVEMAKQLLTEAGYPDGFDLVISVPSSYEVHMQTAEVIVEQLKAVGINASIDAIEWSSWLSDVYTDRNYAATVCALTGDSTPGYLLNRFTSTSSKNFINFDSADYDEVYAKVVAATSMEERGIYYKELQKILVEEAATGFTLCIANKVAVANDLGGYQFYPVYVQDMATVYYVSK